MRPGRSVWIAVALVGLVIVAAGLTGTAHFGGPRFYPHIGSGGQRERAPTFRVAPPAHPRTKTSTSTSGSRTLGFWVLVAALLAAAIAVAVILRRLWNRRRAPALTRPSAARVHGTAAVARAPEPGVEVLLTGIEGALAALDETREPGDAIVRAWLGLEETAQRSGVIRGLSETPTEFTSRTLQGAFSDDRAIATMLRLYLRTRFGDRPPTGEDVVAVREALAQLVSDQRSAAGVTAGGVR